jgi:hypothetical protein
MARVKLARLLLVGGLPALAAVACAIDIPDVVDAGDAQSDAGPPDVATECDASCGAPDGFVPVLFDPTGATPCPNGTAPMDLITGVGNVTAAACGCTCSVTKQPYCLPSTLTVKSDSVGDLSCSGSGTSSVLTGGCDSASYNLARDVAFPPYNPIEAGACVGAQVVDAGAVPVTTARLCTEVQCGTVCTPTNSFKACFLQPGDAGCPTGLDAYHLGSSVDVQCAGCGACTVNSAKCGGTLYVYSDGACQTLVRTNSVDGVCVTQPEWGTAILSNKLVPSIDAGCTPGASAGGTASLASPMTVCCPP